MDDGLDMSRNENTVARHLTENELRTQTLRDMLRFDLQEDDLVPAVRELARLMLYMYDQISTLPDIRASMASTQNLIIKFIEDQMQERRDRLAKELEISNLGAAQARSKLLQTDEWIKRMQFPVTYEKPESPAKESTPAERAWVWYRDKVLPYFATGAAVLILQALWEYFRARVNGP